MALGAGREESDDISPRIVRGKLDSFAIYEITDEELNLLEEGSPSSIYLNFAIFCISSAISFLVSIITSKLSDRFFEMFFIFTVVGFLVGIILFILWLITRRSAKRVVVKIRSRIPVTFNTTSSDHGDDQSSSSDQSESY